MDNLATIFDALCSTLNVEIEVHAVEAA